MPCPGDDLVVLRLRKDTNQGQFQVALDNVPVGIVDGYASMAGPMTSMNAAVAKKPVFRLKPPTKKLMTTRIVP